MIYALGVVLKNANIKLSLFNNFFQNSKKSINELSEKYKQAMKALEDYFHDNLAKIREQERDKTNLVKDRIDDNKDLIVKIADYTVKAERQMKIESMDGFIKVFDKTYGVIVRGKRRSIS